MRANVAVISGAILGATAGLVCLFVLGGRSGEPAESSRAATSKRAAAPAPVPSLERVSGRPAAAPALPKGVKGAKAAPNASRGPRPALPGLDDAAVAGGPAPKVDPARFEDTSNKPEIPITDRVRHGISGFREGVNLSRPITLAGAGASGRTVRLDQAKPLGMVR